MSEAIVEGAADAATSLRSTPSLPDYLEERLEREHFRRAREDWRGEVHFLRTRSAPAGAVELHSNDYLRLADHPEVVEAKIEALRRGGNQALMSAVFLEADAVQHAFEHRAAEWLESEEAILCQSGYATNVGLLQTVAAPDRPLYVDRIAHMSLWDGVRLSGARPVPFRHNDTADLARLLGEHGPGVIVVDSVYSSDGSVCPLAEVVELAEASGSLLVLDESHSLGTHGPGGRGLAAELGLAHRVPFRTASLSKAFCHRGGLIACPGRFVEYFRMHSHPAVFSSAVLSYDAAGLLATLHRIRSDAWRRRRLHRAASRLRSGLADLGYNVAASRSQIVSLEAGSEYRTIYLRDLLAARGVVGAAFVAPATSLSRALVRLTTHCELSDADVDRVLAVCDEVRGLVEVDRWPSTLRLRPGRRSRGPAPVFTRAEDRR